MSPTLVAVGHTVLSNPTAAGIELASQIHEKIGTGRLDAVIVFSSPSFPYEELLASIEEACHPAILVGCSTAGEFSGCHNGTASASIMAIRSDDIKFSAGLGRNLRASRAGVVESLIPSFTGKSKSEFPYKAALVLTDALAGSADELIHELTVRTGGAYQLFGGGAADDAKFHQTHVFFGTQAIADAVVTLEMVSKKPIGIGVKHGWQAVGAPLRVTQAEGTRLISLNAMPAADVFEEHAQALGLLFDRDNPLPFFLHNVIGIDTGGGYKIRVPLSLEADGSINCAAEVPTGATVYIMGTSLESACDAASHAAQAAVRALKGEKLAGSLVFDCAATRLRMGAAFGDELGTIADGLGSTNFAGCNTYGQIARTNDQFDGFHNCTAIICALPA
ncbi:MAG: hypothetical protein JWO49_2882 [Arthrobacter sp.]|jgi:hypothetical protein|nr:hypothetical protein [Arthrobacter sp.]